MATSAVAKVIAPLTRGQGCDIIDGVREVPLWSLQPGQRFELVLNATTLPPHKRKAGTVVRKGPGTIAVVLDHAENETTFTTKEGTLVTLHTSGGICYWSPGTAVLPLAGTKDVSRWTARGGTGVGPNPDYKEKEREMTIEKTAALPIGGSATKTKVAKGKAKPAKGKAKAAKRGTPKELHDCLCGCGERVTGRFRMGHDGRYYGLIKRVIGQELTFSELPKKMQTDLRNVAGAKQALAASGHK